MEMQALCNLNDAFKWDSHFSDAPFPWATVLIIISWCVGIKPTALFAVSYNNRCDKHI